MAKKETTAAWTPNSQAAILRQEELEAQREVLQGRIARQKAEIEKLEKDKASFAESTLHGEGWSHVALDKCLAALREVNDLLDVWEDQLAEVEKKIEACSLSPEAAAEREKDQQAMVGLAEKRLTLDGEIDMALQQLKALLEKRAKLTTDIAGRASAVEMQLDLDAERFEALLDSLPAEMARGSQAWLDRLLGQQKGMVRAFARERLVVAESLAHSGIYAAGDAVELTEEQFAELRRTDRPDATNEEPWRRRPASVYSAEEYEKAVAEAKRKGIGLEEVIFWQNMRQWEEAKKAYQSWLARRRPGESRPDERFLITR